MRRRFSSLFLVIMSIIVLLPYLAHAQAASKPATEMKSLKVGVIVLRADLSPILG